MLKHVARAPVVLNLKSGKFIRVPAQPPTRCMTASKSFPSFLCCESRAQCDFSSGPSILRCPVWQPELSQKTGLAPQEMSY